MRQFECTLKHFIVPNKVQLTNRGGNLINNIKEAANICSSCITQNKYTVHMSVPCDPITNVFLSSYNYHEMVLFLKGVIRSTRPGPRRISLHYHNVPYKQTGPVKRKTCFPIVLKEVETFC